MTATHRLHHIIATSRMHALALLLLGCSSALTRDPAPAPPPGPQYTDVYVAGEGAYHTYRIPSAILTPKGTLLAFAEGRRSGGGDAGDIDLVLRRSTDGGRTWSPMQVIGDDGNNTFGNPCPVVDRRTGTIWLLTTHNPGAAREKDIVAGTSQGSRTVWAMKSDDDGVTWSPALEITNSVKRADWTWYATGPGVGIQTSTGRLVIPANHVEAGTGINRSHLFFSDDGGKSWSLGASADAGTNESQVVELADGRLMLNMRNHPPLRENFRLVAISEDGGRSLSKAFPDRSLLEPPAQASLLRLTTAKTDGRNRLLFANPASTRREKLTVRLSYDEGASWLVARVIDEGPSAYSSLVVLPDQSIGILFERGARSPYKRTADPLDSLRSLGMTTGVIPSEVEGSAPAISFARFTLQWLTAQ